MIEKPYLNIGPQGPQGPLAIQYDANTQSLISGPSYGIYSFNGNPIHTAPLCEYFQGPTGLPYGPLNSHK